MKVDHKLGCSVQLEAATEESDYSPLFITSETTSGVVFPVSGSPIPAGHGHAGASPAKSYEDGWGSVRRGQRSHSV